METIKTPTHFETSYVRIQSIPAKKRVEVQWKDFITDDEGIDALKLAISMAKEHKAVNMLFDNTDFKGASPEANEWVATKFFKFAYEVGVKNTAIVLSPDIFAVFSIETGIDQEMRAIMNIEKFDSPQGGIDWLEKFL